MKKGLNFIPQLNDVVVRFGNDVFKFSNILRIGENSHGDLWVRFNDGTFNDFKGLTGEKAKYFIRQYESFASRELELQRCDEELLDMANETLETLSFEVLRLRSVSPTVTIPNSNFHRVGL